MFNTIAGYGPRAELSVAVVEGEGSVDGLIGSKILGDYPINRRNAHYVKATLANSLALRSFANAKYVRAPGTKFERVSAKLDDGTLTVTLRGVEMVVAFEHKLDYAGYFDLLNFWSKRIGEGMARTKEKLIAAAIFNTTNFGSAVNSTVAYTAANLYNNGATGISFISDVIAATRRLRAAGEAPGYVAVMSGPVFERIRQAFTVQGYVTGTLRGTQEATESMIKNALAEFGITDILVADSYENTAAEGATPVLSQIWSNAYIWVGKPGSTGGSSTEGATVPSITGVGANVYWEGYDDGGIPNADSDGSTYEGGNYVEVYPSKEIEAEVIRAKNSSTPTITNPRGGTLVATQYA